MKINEIMSTALVTIDADDRLFNAKKLFEKYKFHHLLVVDGQGKLVGVLSDRDLFKAISPNIGLASEKEKDLATLNKRVHQIASRDITCVDEKASLKVAIQLFKENRISCLPVVNPQNKPVGIMSWRDIINWLYSKVNKGE